VDHEALETRLELFRSAAHGGWRARSVENAGDMPLWVVSLLILKGVLKMATKEELQAAVQAAKKTLADAEAAVDAFDALAENNVFPTMDEALCIVEDMLRDRATEACEGRYRCGKPEYSQAFMVGETKYLGTAKFEYNRHDKTYYYVDGCEFSHKEIEPVSV